MVVFSCINRWLDFVRFRYLINSKVFREASRENKEEKILITSKITTFPRKSIDIL